MNIPNYAYALSVTGTLTTCEEKPQKIACSPSRAAVTVTKTSTVPSLQKAHLAIKNADYADRMAQMPALSRVVTSPFAWTVQAIFANASFARQDWLSKFAIFCHFLIRR